MLTGLHWLMGESLLQTRQPVREGQPALQGTPDALITVQDIMAWVYLYPLRGLSHLIPVSVLLWLTQGLAPLYAHLRRDVTGLVGRNMTSALEGLGMRAAPEIMARSFVARDLRKAIDDLVIRRLDTESLKARATIHGIEFLDEALAEGNGVIVISGHFNANRLAKYYLRRNGYSLMSVRNRSPDAMMLAGRFGRRYLAPAYGRFLGAIVEEEIQLQDRNLGQSELSSQENKISTRLRGLNGRVLSNASEKGL